MVATTSFFGSTFKRSVSFTVVRGADLNFDFSAKSGFEVTGGIAETGGVSVEVFSVVLTSGEDTAPLSASSADVSASTLIFFLIPPAGGSIDGVE